MKSVKYQKLRTHSDIIMRFHDQTISDIKRMAGFDILLGLGLKKPKTPKDAYLNLSKIALSNGMMFGSDLNDIIASLDHNFLTKSNHVIFPESSEIVDTLMRTVISGKANLSALELPFTSFAFMMPEGYKTPSGRPLKSFIVNWGKKKELSQCLANFVEHIGLDIPKTYKSDENDERMQITVSFYSGDLEFSSVVAYMDDILGLFQETNGKELDLNEATNRVTHDVGSIKKAFEENDKDGLACYDMIKIAISLAIHKNVFGDQIWVDELPKTKAHKGSIPNNLPIKIHGLKPLLRKHSTNGKGKSRSTELPGHIRGTHFRNLRDPKYYRGEFSRYAPESRWTVVSESWVGYEIQPHTVKSK